LAAEEAAAFDFQDVKERAMALAKARILVMRFSCL